MLKYSIFLGMISLVFSVSANTIDVPKNLLTLYVFPSPKGIDWTTPRSLVASTLENSISPSRYRLKHSIGHVSVELRCDNGFWKTTGMTSASDTEDFSVVFFKKLGLGTLFHSFQGRLQSDSEVINDIQERIPKGDVAWIRFEISSTACQRLETYLSEYTQDQVEENYGLNLRARYREGSGCSEFAMSFLDLAGFLSNERIDAWKAERKVPLSLIGSPQKPVGVGNILWSRAGQNWADSNVPHRVISYWDPDTLFKWIRSRSGTHLGLTYDERSVPVPVDDIWKSE